MAGPQTTDEAVAALRVEVAQLREQIVKEVLEGLRESKKKKIDVHVGETAERTADVKRMLRRSFTSRKLRVAAHVAASIEGLNDGIAHAETVEAAPAHRRGSMAALASLVSAGPQRHLEQTWYQHAPCLISETHWARQGWDLVSAALIIISLVQAPLDLGFASFLEGNTALFVFEMFTDVFFCSDVLLNFFTTYVANGNEVRSLKKICKRYLTGWFPIDVMASIPFSLLSLGDGGGDDGGGGAHSNLRVLKALKLMKIGRVFRLKKAGKLIEDYCPGLPPGVLSLIGLIGCQLFVMHTAACLFWLVECSAAFAERAPEWTRSDEGGCYDHPPTVLPSSMYTFLGDADAARLHEALDEAGDWGTLDAGLAARSARRLLGGRYHAGAAAMLSQPWSAVVAAMPRAAAAELDWSLNVTLDEFGGTGWADAECAGSGAPHAVAMLASAMVEASRRRLTLGQAYFYSTYRALALSVGETYEPTSPLSGVYVTVTVFVFIYFQSFIIGYVCNVVENMDQVHAFRCLPIPIRFHLTRSHSLPFLAIPSHPF